MAISALPADGDQLLAPILLSADAVDTSNSLTIILDDTSNPGFVTATITTESLSAGSSTGVFFNFSSIIFTANADADGAIVNDVVVRSPYEVAVVGFGSSGTGSPLSQTNWQIDSLFSASPSLPADSFIELFNADSLSVAAGSLGGSAKSTVAGEFQSPTDLSDPARTGAVVELVDSGVGIADRANVAVRTYQLNLESTNGEISIDANVGTIADLFVEVASGNLSLGDATGVVSRTFSSDKGDIRVSSSAGPVSISGVLFTAAEGGIAVTTPGSLSVGGASPSFTAPQPFAPPPPAAPDVANGLVRLEGGISLTLPASLPITAGRLELATTGTSAVSLSALSVASLAAALGGDLDVVNAIPLTISDYTGVPTVEITAADVAIRSPAGIRVVDGIQASGTFVLSTWVTGTTTAPTIPVDFVVTASGDNPILSDPFEGTLRDMIEYVNANGILPAASLNGVTTQPARLLFDEVGSAVAGTGTVTLTATLPSLEKAVTLDGSLPSGDDVVIDGNGVAANGVVLGVGSSGSTIRDAAFEGFVGAGVRVESGDNVLSGLVLGGGAGNGIGVDLFGPAALRNVIGVKSVGVDEGNYIVGNTQAGVLIRGGANYNAIYGNTIGDVGLGNADGVHVVSSIGTLIGASQRDLRNTISNNTSNGIRLTGVNAVASTYGSRVVNNVIDDNGGAGVLIEGGRANVVGGTEFNSGNSFTGNSIAVHMLSNGTGRTQGNQIVGNAILNSETGGILIDQGFSNLVQGNQISDVVGDSDFGVRIFRAPQSRALGPNQVFQNTISGAGDAPLTGGIVVENSSGQVVGGAGTLGNVVVENGGSGIVIIGGAGVNVARANLIEGNLVGTDSAGNELGNAFDGIRIQGSVGNLVRGNTVRNHDSVLNSGTGIAVHDALALGPATGNTIVLNTVANNEVGIRVVGGGHTAIGGRVAGLGNWVFANLSDGIRVVKSDATGDSTSTVIRGNWVGVATGPLPAGNGGYGINLAGTVGTRVDTGNLVAYNAEGGIRMAGGRSAVIGSAMAGLGNIIRENNGDGISVVEPVGLGRTEAVQISGNLVRDNDGNGISIADTSAPTPATARVSGITVGRAVAVTRPDAAGNTIVGNGGVGVLVDRAQAVAIVGNAITGNAGASEISLINDANSVPFAASVASPELFSATPRVAGQASSQFDVVGQVARTGSGTAAQTVLVDIYGTNTATNEQFFLGRVIVTVRAMQASASFRVVVGKVGARFDQIIATATIRSATSEFSNALVV